jgi:hypothetical protein
MTNVPFDTLLAVIHEVLSICRSGIRIKDWIEVIRQADGTVHGYHPGAVCLLTRTLTVVGISNTFVRRHFLDRSFEGKKELTATA